MSDLLIRDVPENVVAALDAKAARLGLSRTEYLRRRLTVEASGESETTELGLREFSSAFADLADPATMNAAWR